MRYYDYEEFKKDVDILVKDIKGNFKPDVILAIARGGMTLGHFLAEALQMRDLYALNSVHYEETHKLDTIEVFNVPDLSNKKDVLMVDDMIDSGETMIEIKRILLEKYPHLNLKIATLFYKQKALLHPDFTAQEANDWIEFFWEHYKGRD